MSNTRCTINGGCGSSDAMAEYQNGFYCFSCKKSKKKSYGEILDKSINKTFDELIFASNFNKKASKNITELPKDLIDIPINCQYYKWLRKYWPQSNFPSAIKYSPEHDKLVVLLGSDNFFIRGNNPKYTRLVSEYTSDFTPNLLNMDSLTIVEDIFSALKISRFVSAYCLFGSSMSSTLMRTIDDLQAFYIERIKVNVWLDKDSAGIKGSNKIVKTLQNFGINVKQIFTDKDPKECTEEEIKKVLA